MAENEHESPNERTESTPSAEASAAGSAEARAPEAVAIKAADVAERLTDPSSSTPFRPTEPALVEAAAPPETSAEGAPDASANEASPAAADAETPSKSDETAASAPAEAAPEAAAPEGTEAAPEATPAAEPAPEPAPKADPPHIEVMEPSHGPLIGGVRVRIRGRAFSAGCSVKFGDVDVSIADATEAEIVAIAPQRASAGYVDVLVTNADGQREVRVNGFAYDAPPRAVSAEPSALSLRGGKACILGASFAEGLSVTWNGQPVPVTFKGEDCLEVMIPGGEAGPVTLEITNPDGQSAKLEGKLTLSEGPVISAVEPSVGLPAGGTRITVMGRGFVHGCAVTFFGDLAPDVLFESEKKIAFIAPPHEPGTGGVRVQNPDGLWGLLEGAFSYRAAPPPALAQVTPDRAWVTGGARLIVNGQDFVDGCTATIGGKAAQLKWKSAGLVEVIVPAGEVLGAVPLVIVNPDGQATSGTFLYEKVPTPPKLIQVQPGRAPTLGNVTVTFTGDNFDEQTVVRIGEVRTVTRLISKTEMEVTVPPRPTEGKVAIELVSGDGVVVRSEEAFIYNNQPPPRITGVSPQTGPMSGGTRVTLEGEHFLSDTYVRIGREKPKSTTIKNSQTIEIVTPPLKTSGFVDIEVGSDRTGSTLSKNAFRFLPVPPPSIESVAPNRGRVDGGTELSIAGKNFTTDSGVLIGGKPVKFKLISSELIECKTPPGNDGQMVDVVVRNAEGKEAVSRRAFAYDGRYKA